MQVFLILTDIVQFVLVITCTSITTGHFVVCCMGVGWPVGLCMGWVGSWVHKFTWQWDGLGWVWVDEMDQWTTTVYTTEVV